MLSEIIEQREKFMQEIGYPMPVINLSQKQYNELKEDLRQCAIGKCGTHAPTEVMGTQIRVV